ncbi:MAG: mechanosensitive ion channel family protein [Treponema sp.]|jgi:small-conductance mechanosensitive channel|nr:mechanosensitive ion channel family protein [Treponema sp.]
MNFWKQLVAIISGDASKFNITIRLGIAAAFLVFLVLLISVTLAFFKWLRTRLTLVAKKHMPSLRIKKFQLLETRQILGVFYIAINAVKYIILFLEFFLVTPLVFSLFVPTQDFAAVFFSYMLDPLEKIGRGIIGYIPNLITIIILLFIVRYTLRSLKFFATRIEREKIVIPGFYPEWAQPTFNILRFLIYAFTIAVVYPYLPGSDSRIFQGVSVFVGVILSLGSSSAIGNLVAGIVLTYMRPFKTGDRIQIQNITGFVVEKSPINIKLRTHKNEYVSFPNMMVLSSSVTNYHTSTEDNKEGLVLYADITFSYGTPWQTIHKLLVEAGRKTTRVLKTPEPFVLQTSLDDFYAHYQINVYVNEVEYVPEIYSELFENIQTTFKEAGLDLTAAHFRINLPPQVTQ